MKKISILFMLLVFCTALGACTATKNEMQSAAPQETGTWISPDTQDTYASEYTATLYFRFRDTDMLAAETRALTVFRNESREKAIVQALIDGPSAAYSDALITLFPPNTEVLSTQVQDKILFVTFNEALLGKYSDEPSDYQSNANHREAAVLRRRLCMDALVNTLTETGDYSAVQVLVMRESSISESMRLDSTYYLETEKYLLPPLTRNEDTILTPHNTAEALFKAWSRTDYSLLYRFVIAQNPQTGAARPAENNAISVFSSAPVLVDYTLSGGSVSSDGQSAVVVVHMTLRQSDGTEITVDAFPLRLIRSGSIWCVTYDQIFSLMQL